MYPEGFHPIQQHILPDYSREIKPLPRSEAIPKYYYTGFDVSVFVSFDNIDSDPAELQTARPGRAAFEVDISDLGTLFQKEFFEVRGGYCPKLHRTLIKRRYSGLRTSKSSGHSFIRW